MEHREYFNSMCYALCALCSSNMKRSELIFSFVLVPLDFAAIVLAGISAYYIRYAEFFQELRPVIFNLEFESYLRIVFIIAVFWLVIFALAGLYAIRGARKLIKELYRVVLACSTGLSR